MAILDRFLKQDAENGLSYRFNKDYKIVLTRIPLPEGIEVYLIENKSKNERLIIPRELFDRFRSGVLEFSQVIERNKSSNQELEKTIYFKDQEIYRLRTSVGDATKIIIQDGIRLKGSTGHLTVPSLALAELSKFFYQPQLKHTNDIFERLVKYHKLFQFSFTAGSESINSQLILRRDLLSQIEDYTPRIQAKTGTHQLEDDDGREDLQHIHSNPQGTPSTAKNLQSNFKSKLGRRDSEKNYTVDYDTLFQKTQAAELTRLPKAADDQTKRGSAAHIKSFPLALKASDLKNLTKLPFLCSLTLDEASFLREVFLEDRQVDLFLGFEMLDAIYKSENKLKTFRFPLYYMKVSIEESGRTLLIHPNKKPEIYLNHLALTSLVESFGIEGSNSVNPIDQFFQTLLTQKIEIGGRLSELSVSMQLPVCEDMFQRTRDILLGLEGENGKGGILGNLNLVGIECDLDSVLLYKASHHVSPIARALEHDIDRIQSVADDYPNRFYRSLLGRFLNPELKMSSPSTQDFYPRHFCPGALPHSTQEIFQKLKEHDIVVLEGPPGTGKTFAIMNLLIHCVNTGQKLLVVSDQKSALHALDEKLQEFLVGHRQGNPTAKNQLSLYRQAIKLVDQLPDKSLSLPHWISILSECLALEATRHPQPDLPASKLQDS
ncbi:MAG: hypothetical protein NTX25_07520, partial [Proteobacteria bacterium]|nr:hypothetical protein [Pseudomonadota bacterium]